MYYNTLQCSLSQIPEYNIMHLLSKLNNDFLSSPL